LTACFSREAARNRRATGHLFPLCEKHISGLHRSRSRRLRGGSGRREKEAERRESLRHLARRASRRLCLAARVTGEATTVAASTPRRHSSCHRRLPPRSPLATPYPVNLRHRPYITARLQPSRALLINAMQCWRDAADAGGIKSRSEGASSYFRGVSPSSSPSRRDFNWPAQEQRDAAGFISRTRGFRTSLLRV